MTENNLPPSAEPQSQPKLESTLRQLIDMPKGVLQKNLKSLVYLGAAILVIIAALFSSSGKKTAGQTSAAKSLPPQPIIEDNTENNVQELKNQLQTGRQKQQRAAPASTEDLAPATVNPAQTAATPTYGPTAFGSPCGPDQPCPPPEQAAIASQLTPEQEQAQQMAARERERLDNSRFASNLVYARNREQTQQPQPSQSMSTAHDEIARPTNDRAATPQSSRETQPAEAGYKRPVEADIDSATGQPYLVYEGSVLDTVLMNRLDGDAVGAVNVLVSNPLYSHDHQHVLIPEGTVVLGEARKIGPAGFGQQRRMAVVFHRLIMPDGYSVDLDQFHGLDQIGEEGLKDKVDNHYIQIFGTSIALGVVAGAAEITQGGGTITTSGSQAFTNGAAGSVSQSATTILDRFIQIPPTITIREGHRVKVYFTQDLLLPAYSNHTIPQTF